MDWPSASGAVLDSVFDSNGSGVVVSEDQSSTDLVIDRCTIFGSSSYGVDILDAGHVDLLSSIVHRNTDDLHATGSGSFDISNCDIGDGDSAGTNGNFSADPLFVDPAGGDLRLGWGSPCAETGLLTGPDGRFDHFGRARPADSDLDLTKAPDVGALELLTLDRFRGDPAGPFVLEVFGEPGGTTVVYFQRKPLATTPLATAFGDLYLDPAVMRPFALVGHSGSHLPARVNRLLHLAVGGGSQPVSFQALSSSSLAPLGSAWSNPLPFGQ
jgi:hypothetical protein